MSDPPKEGLKAKLPQLWRDEEGEDADETRIGQSVQLLVPDAATSRPRAYFIVLAGANVGQMFRIEGDEYVIGRGNNTALRLLDDGVSRNHAKIVVEGEDLFIEDLKSANGTLVNGQPIARRQLLDGDKVQVGSTTILKFTYQDELDETFQKKMYDAALRDELTKAYNKRHFLDRLQTELTFVRRHKSPLSLVMFDVDFFKKVNDTHGHLGGDYVLATISQLSMKALRVEDFFARYGGEEFAIVCRGSTAAQALIAAERLRLIIEAAPLTFQSKALRVTISLGIAGHIENNASTPTQLIALADAALYEAKRAGRNRSVLSTATASATTGG